jgi:DNA-binding HxlR family transcriptional regulator
MRPRLKEAGIVGRPFCKQHPPRAEYMQTKKVEKLHPVLKTLSDLGQRDRRYRASDQ